MRESPGGVKQQRFPVHRQHLRRHQYRSFRTLERREEIEIRFENGDAGRYGCVKRMDVDGVPLPFDPLPAGFERQSRQFRQGTVGRRMSAQLPFGIEQGQRSWLDGNALLNLENFLSHIGRIDPQINGPGIGDVPGQRDILSAKGGRQCAQRGDHDRIELHRMRFPRLRLAASVYPLGCATAFMSRWIVPPAAIKVLA